MIPNSRYTYSTGWNLQNIHRGRINNFGYASPFDYQPGSGGVAVFGDSYIESLMNDYQDTMQGSLNNYLKTPRTVMSFGMAGAEMPDYLGTAPLIRERFSPEWAVIVITAGDFTRGFNAAPGYFEWDADRAPPIRLVPEIHRSASAKLLRKVALIRYVRGNLSIRPAELVSLRRGAESTQAAACRPEALSKEDEALIESYARALPEALGLNAGSHHPGLRFGSQGAGARQSFRATMGLSATRHARQCPAQGNRCGRPECMSSTAPRSSSAAYRGPGAGGSIAGRSTLELGRSSAHGAGSGA